MNWRAGLLVSGLFLGATLHPAGAARAELTADPKFRDAVAKAESRLRGGDAAGAKAALAALSPASPLEKYMVSSLALEVATKNGDMVAQRKAVADVLESGAAPQGQLAYLNHIAGYLSYQTGAIDNAITYLARARELGRTDPQTSLLLTESLVRKRRTDEALKVLGETISAQVQAGKPVPASWYDRAAALAYARKDWASLASYNAGKLRDPSVGGPDWRSALATYVEGARPDKEAELDLYRLQAATGGLASERDYQGYAALAAGQGYAVEAQSVIEGGASAGKLASSDPTAATLLRTVKPKAIKTLSAMKALPGKAGAVANGARAAQDGDSLLASSQYAAAVPYYRAALDKGGVDRNRVSTRLGIALARSGDFDGAGAALKQVSGAWAPVATYWAAWVDARKLGGAAQAAADGTGAAKTIAMKQ